MQNFGRESVILNHTAYKTFDFKKMVNNLFQAGSANVSREKLSYQNITKLSEHGNSPAIQNDLAIDQSDVTLKIPS